MNPYFITLAFLSSTVSLAAVVDEKSPDFLFGKETRPNLTLKASDNPDMGVSLGIRFQGTAEVSKSGGDSAFDAYGRRVRFEFGAQFSRDMSFVMDLRNDNANRGDGGERKFNIGDAYLTVRRLGGYNFLNLKALRGKVDVSRAETAKSSWMVLYDRPAVADEAAQYVNHNRRATNLQLFGDFDNKVAYSVAVGDGVQSADFADALGNGVTAIVSQNPMVGGKIILSPFEGWEETRRTETYFGVGKHVAVGVGAFVTSGIRFRPTAAAAIAEVSRTLLNVEASFHYESLFLEFEYFRFFDVVENYAAPTLNRGQSDGWYALVEYVSPRFWYLAPFVRYERWNRFRGVPGYIQVGHAGGINWYLRGNTFRLGLAVQSDTVGAMLGSETTVTYKLLSQLHF